MDRVDVNGSATRIEHAQANEYEYVESAVHVNVLAHVPRTRSEA
jgi:hypothetical protein